jgi:hypothetical protein
MTAKLERGVVAFWVLILLHVGLDVKALGQSGPGPVPRGGEERTGIGVDFFAEGYSDLQLVLWERGDYVFYVGSTVFPGHFRLGLVGTNFLVRPEVVGTNRVQFGFELVRDVYRLEPGEEIGLTPPAESIWSEGLYGQLWDMEFVRGGTWSRGGVWATEPGFVGYQVRGSAGVRYAWQWYEASTVLPGYNLGNSTNSWEPRRGVPARAGVPGGEPGWAPTWRRVPVDLDSNGVVDVDFVVFAYLPTNGVPAVGTEYTVSLLPRSHVDVQISRESPIPSFGRPSTQFFERGATIRPEQISGSDLWSASAPTGKVPYLLWSGTLGVGQTMGDLEGPFARRAGWIGWRTPTIEGWRVGWLAIPQQALEPGDSAFERQAGRAIAAGMPGTAPPDNFERTPWDLDGDGRADVVRLAMYSTNSGTTNLARLAFEPLHSVEFLTDADGPGTTLRMYGARDRQILRIPWPTNTAWRALRAVIRDSVDDADEVASSDGVWAIPLQAAGSDAGSVSVGYMAVQTNGALGFFSGWKSIARNARRGSYVFSVQLYARSVTDTWVIDWDNDGLADVTGSYSSNVEETSLTPSRPYLEIRTSMSAMGLFSSHGARIFDPLPGLFRGPFRLTARSVESGGLITPEADNSGMPSGMPVFGEYPQHMATSSSVRTDGPGFSSPSIHTALPYVPMHIPRADGWHAAWIQLSPTFSWYEHPEPGVSIYAGTHIPTNSPPVLWWDKGTIFRGRLRWAPVGTSNRLEAFPLGPGAVWVPVRGATNGVFDVPESQRGILYRLGRPSP